MTALRRYVFQNAWLGVLLIATSLAVKAQDAPGDLTHQGEVVFAKNCSFCHGEAGSGRNAPKLSERGFDGQHIEQVIAFGVKDTAMAAWGQILDPQELASVVTYIKSLNGIAGPAGSNTPLVLSGDASHGRDLFRDATRGLSACSNCHAIEGKGVNIAPLGTQFPSSASALRNAATAQVKTVTVNGERFPALVSTPSGGEMRLYDLIAVPPVLRTFTTQTVQVSDASTWQHASVVGAAYSDQELTLIIAYLQAARKP